MWPYKNKTNGRPIAFKEPLITFYYRSVLLTMDWYWEYGFYHRSVEFIYDRARYENRDNFSKVLLTIDVTRMILQNIKPVFEDFFFDLGRIGQ